MDLHDLGYTESLEIYKKEHNLEGFDVGRVIAEHKERYVVRSTDGEFEGEIVGNLRFAAQSRADFPAVGDWVAISDYDTDKVLIHTVFPRSSSIERKVVGKSSDIQIIASNVDYGFIVQAVDRDFNLNRIERYLTICNSANVEPVILLTKIDLISEDERSEIVSKVEHRTKNITVLTLSNITSEGIDIVKKQIVKGKTYCLLGSSGVGKSSLINSLTQDTVMKTDAISDSNNKGRHITTHRELIVLDSGGIIIDNPGMREISIADTTDGVEITFEDILEIAADCRYKDCSHTVEAGCAVLQAVEDGEIPQSVYENYMKLEREKVHFEQSVSEKRKKGKNLAKVIKDLKKTQKKNNW